MSRHERLTLTALAVVAAILRIALLFRYRFDSDEPQHLHVAWGGTVGQVQYRDLFDNHTPLFHLLTAPILAMFGERSNILILMRVPMLLLFGIVLWSTWVVASRLWSKQVATWSTLVLALFPPFALKSIEYRPDNLWAALWMLALVVLTGGPLTAMRLFGAGLLLGAALATSMKTLLIVGPIVIAAGILLSVRQERVPAPRRLLAAAAGFAVVPLILLGVFASLGALKSLVWCVVHFNSYATAEGWHLWAGRILWPLAMLALWRVARRWRASDPWRLFIGLVTAICAITIICPLRLITPRDFLAVMPLLAIFAAGALLRAERSVRALAIYGTLSLVALFYYADRLENRTDEQITMIDQVLRLSKPGEPLMDIKGETIFRRRPFYYAFETITRKAMRDELIPDTIAQSMIDARCYVAQADGPFLPPLGRQFMRRNYIDMGRIRVAGQWIGEDGTFTIAVPGSYVVVSEKGVASGLLDATPSSGPRTLAAGTHRFARTTAKERVAVMWAPAFARGGSPFHLRDLDF
jgi:hypothetical protein